MTTRLRAEFSSVEPYLPHAAIFLEGGSNKREMIALLM